MKRVLLFLLLTLAASVKGAVGDTLGLSVRPNGRIVDWYISGLATNGTYAFGLSSSNTVEAAKFYLTYTVQGYDGAGAPTTLTVTNYSGTRARLPVVTGTAEPNVADETVSGTNLIVGVSMASYIPQGASNILAYVSSGLYTQGTVSAAASGVNVTNMSTQGYGRSITKWSWPGWQRDVGSNVTLRMLAFHRSGRNYLPVRAVRFIGTDAHANSVSTVVTNWTLSSGVGDALPFGEVVANVDVSTLTQGDPIRWDYVVTPWVGDTNSVFDTRKDEFTGITPLPKAITNLLDKTDSYGFSYALVRTNGNDSTGVAFTRAQYATNSAALTNAFATIRGATTAIAATNNTVYSRNDAGASYILLDNGDYAFTGGTVSGGAATIPAAWLTITTNIGASTASTRITSSSGTQDINDRVKFKGITFNVAASVVNNCEALWMDACDLTSSASQTILATTGKTEWYLTANTIRSFTQGIKYAANYNVAPAIVRGNTFDGFSQTLHAYCAVGNIFTNSPFAIVRIDFASQPTPNNDLYVIYNNKLFASELTASKYQGPQQTNIVFGGAFIQNVFESTTNNINNLAWDFGSNNSIQLTNLLEWHNVLVGCKDFHGYNDTGTNVAWRILWSVQNNIWADYNNKSYDHGTTLVGGADTNRVGAEALKHGVDYTGNMFAEIAGVGAPGSFLPNPFYGLNTWYTNGTSTISVIGFVDHKAYDGTGSSGTGYGNYQLTTNSPMNWLARTHLLPYDINGNSRVTKDASGAFASLLTTDSGSGVGGSSTYPDYFRNILLRGNVRLK